MVNLYDYCTKYRLKDGFNSNFYINKKSKRKLYALSLKIYSLSSWIKYIITDWEGEYNDNKIRIGFIEPLDGKATKNTRKCYNLLRKPNNIHILDIKHSSERVKNLYEKY